MKKWIFMAMAAMAVFAVVSCGGDDDKPSNVTLTFELGETRDGPVTGAPPAKLSVQKGKTAKLPDVSSKAPAGWAFVTWFNKDGGAPVDSKTVFNSNATLVAEWTDNLVQVSFDLNYTGAPANPAPILIPAGSLAEAGKDLPVVLRDKWALLGWFPQATGGSSTSKYTNATQITVDITLYAQWVADVLTAETTDTGAELLYLENGAQALYQFDLPAGASLADYTSVSYQVKASAAAIVLWQSGGGVNSSALRTERLYGVYVPGGQVITTDPNGTTAYNLNNYNAPYIIRDNLGSATVVDAATANEWFPLTFSLSGSENAGFSADNAADIKKTGTVYFGLGLSCQTSTNGTEMREQFVHLVKDVKLNPTTSSGKAAVDGKRPEKAIAVFPDITYDVADFVSYVSPIVFSFRTSENLQHSIENWKTLIPTEPPVTPFDRGAPPANLVKVDLSSGTDVFTYLRPSTNNYNNQRGWVSFEEAGRANSKDSSAPSSTVVFANFKEAWYLELKAAAKPTGTLTIVWMGPAGGWVEGTATENTGAAIEGKSEITENDDGTFTIKIFLPGALGRYQEYYETNTEWAGLALSYWGASSHTLADVDITEAYLLVQTAAASAEGVSLGVTFKLGTAPEGGNIIDDISLNPAGTTLTVIAAGGLTDFAWYVDGVKDAATGDELNITGLTATDANKVVTLRAKKDGKWVSQSVNITLKK